MCGGPTEVWVGPTEVCCGWGPSLWFVQSVAAEVDVIRQSMSALRKEAQSTQHKSLDRLEEVGWTH